MHQKWDERYKDTEFAYGKAPNEFFKQSLTPLPQGSILMPADGEGRNGVFAAGLGWKVISFDLSAEGQAKALQLAKEHDVSLHYIVGDFEQLDFRDASFDAIGLIYAHFPADKKAAFHKKLSTLLKPGGIVIFEAFSKNHLDYIKANPNIGGPKEIDMLYSSTEITTDFENYEVLLLEEKEIELQEGKYHNGKGSVIRFIGRKAAGKG